MEAPIEHLNDDQTKLREAALAMECRGVPPDENPERPRWANGAFVYLDRESEEEIRLAITERKPEADGLMSKHILVSESLFELVERVLNAKPDGKRTGVFPISPRRRDMHAGRDQAQDLSSA